MIIYIESQAKSYPLAQKILSKFADAYIIEIDHYKNIFDKNIWAKSLANAIILAKQQNIPIFPTPANYGYSWKSFFFKSILNCIFDCEYCYLKWAFKTPFPTIFVNYEDIQDAIADQITSLRQSGYNDTIYFYASNYSDIQWLDNFVDFNQSFIPFFEKFPNVLMESRTKSSNIQSLLSLENKSLNHFSNTEISFSLNPQSIIDSFEHKTSSLEQRIDAINTLISNWRKVWIRFLPLLPVENYLEIYSDFISYVKKKIDFDRVNSIFIWSIIYTKSDYNNLVKRWNFIFESKFQEHSDWFMRIQESITNDFKLLFTSAFPNKQILFDII